MATQKESTKYLKIEKENLFLKVVLNRPEKRNAFHPQMIQELTHVFKDLTSQEDLKGVLLYGEGPSFCAGADLGWMKSMVNYNFDENLKDSKELHEMFEVIAHCPIPVLCKAHGHVMGGALGLLAVCDIVAAEEKTLFAFSEVQLGLVPAVISPFVLKKMPLTKATEFMLTGERFNASEAVFSRLIHFSGTHEEVDQYLTEKMKWLQKSEPQGVRETKKLLLRLTEPQLFSEGSQQDIQKLTTQVISQRRVSESAQERLRWFLDANK